MYFLTRIEAESSKAQCRRVRGTSRVGQGEQAVIYVLRPYFFALR